MRDIEEGREGECAWNSSSGAMYSGVPQEDLQVDCPTTSLLNPKSHIFSSHPPFSIILSSCGPTPSNQTHAFAHYHQKRIISLP